MRNTLTLILLAAGLCLTTLSACGDDSGKDTSAEADTDTDTDTDTDADADADTDSDTDTDAPTLDSSHPGWQNPLCSQCHTATDQHFSDLDPWECVECHGDNGAPDGHGGNPPCSNCHGQPHGANGFPAPESCQTCHPG